MSIPDEARNSTRTLINKSIRHCQKIGQLSIFQWPISGDEITRQKLGQTIMSERMAEAFKNRVQNVGR